MATADSISAITRSLPPASDYLTYLTILESHLSPEILPTLSDILQDAQLTQNIGWDLISLLLPLPGADKCLATIARLGNPREVILKVTEALQYLDLDDTEEDEGSSALIPTNVDKFCTLVSLLSILHPRIKTKYPSRFLSTSLMAILSVLRPSNQATLAVVSFVHTVSGTKRPPLPGRKSSLKIPTVSMAGSGSSAPDPEAQEEDPKEAAIQAKLLQSFITHVLELYINSNVLEWSARLQEHFEPGRVLVNESAGRSSLGEAFKEQPELLTRDTMVGQLVALLRDLGLLKYDLLFEAIYKPDSSKLEDDDPEDNYPSSPADIPLSRAGSLYSITSLLFSSILFDSQTAPPNISVFPDHSKLLHQFIGIEGPGFIGGEEAGTIDAILAIGLWMEHNNKFVAGPLEDSEFLQHLQSLSLLSANNPSSTLRYAAHSLTSSILHAHPVDRLRLTFITDTLEHCPYESLKASAVCWLKEEIITAHERKSENLFSSTVALAAVQPYLFPSISGLEKAPDEEIVQELAQSFSFHMAAVNFAYFIRAEQYGHVIPEGMFPVVEEIYLAPLKAAQEKALESINKDEKNGSNETVTSRLDMELLGQRISMCLASRSDE